jgi:3-oxoacyl-ACP reductase-like protein
LVLSTFKENRMSLFGSIMDKIFHRHPAATPSAPPVDPVAPAAQAAPAPTAAAPPPEPVDVEAVLSALAAEKGGGGNWRTSIVDLLKLLDLDSSLAARKDLANELNVHVGADGSAEENIALQKAVWRKLAENGGKVPDSLKD